MSSVCPCLELVSRNRSISLMIPFSPRKGAYLCCVLLSFSKNHGFQIFQKLKIKELMVLGISKKSESNNRLVLGILKTVKSKNCQYWVFQNPQRTFSFHEGTVGSFPGWRKVVNEWDLTTWMKKGPGWTQSSPMICTKWLRYLLKLILQKCNWPYRCNHIDETNHFNEIVNTNEPW